MKVQSTPVNATKQMTVDISIAGTNSYQVITDSKKCIVTHNTLSLLAGTTPGVHPGYSQYYIRRIRFASNSPLIQICKSHGYPNEFQRNFDGTLDRDTTIISFPCKFPKGTILANNCTAIDQLEFVKRMQTEWSDNSVSCTVYYKKEELPTIKDWLRKNFTNSVKTVSFLLHNEHGFDQAPYEEITEEAFNELNGKVKPILLILGGNTKEDEKFQSETECSKGSCPLK